MADARIQFNLTDVIEHCITIGRRLLLPEPVVRSYMLLSGEIVSLARAPTYLILLDHSSLISE